MRQPEITVSRAAHGQSEEVAATIGDTIAELRAALETSEADAQTLRDAGKALVQGSWIVPMHTWEALAACVYAEHPSASLHAELAAARAIVEEFRWSGGTCICPTCERQRALYAAYDAAVQARGR